MLSVITVCRNSEKTIGRTINSILNQTTENYFEHIFIDGASEDGTVDVIKSYRDDYAKKNIKMTMISEKDNGINDACNKGIHVAKGNIIGFLNSDDWYEPETVAIIQKTYNEHPEIDIIMGAGYIHNRGQIIIKRPRKSFIVTSRNFNHPAMFVKKECYQDVGDYKLKGGFEDFDWYLRALNKEKKVLLINNILSNFSVGGVSTQKSFPHTLKKIRLRYSIYRNNGYSRLYLIECIFQELAKYCLIRR